MKKEIFTILLGTYKFISILESCPNKKAKYDYFLKEINDDKLYNIEYDQHGFYIQTDSKGLAKFKLMYSNHEGYQYITIL